MPLRHVLKFVCVLLLWGPNSVFAKNAQPGQPFQTGPVQQPQVQPWDTEQYPEDRQGIVDDAGSTGMWFSPTAHVAPEGTWTFENNELFLVGGSYSVTDKLAFSAHTLIPLGFDIYPFVVSGKYAILDRGKLRLAATGSIAGVSGLDDELDDAFVSGIGGIASLCIDTACSTFLNASATGLILFGADVEQTTIPFLFSLGITQKISHRAKLLVEVIGSAAFGDTDSNGLLAGYGVRLGNDFIGVNLGFAKALSEDGDSDILPLGLPWVSLVYRGD